MTLRPRPTTSSRRAGLAVATGTLLVLAGCGTSSPEPDPAPPGPDATAGGASPAPPERTVTFTEPVVTDFACDCLALPVGAGPDGEVAVAADLPVPQGGDAAQPRVDVLEPEGQTRWSVDLDPATVTSGAPEAPALAAPSALVAVSGEQVLGLSWEDGEELWQAGGGGSLPLAAGPEGDQLVLASTLFSEEETSHPEVALFGAEDGETIWQGEDLTAYAVDSVTGDLVLLEGGEDAATLTRVTPADGGEDVVEVPEWAGRVLNLRSEDGVVSAFVGEEDSGETRSVVVDWESGGVSEPEVPAEPAPPEGQELVAGSEDGGFVLGATVESGVPTTAHLSDAEGTELWQRPAAEVLSWTGSDDELTIADVELVLSPAPGSEPRGVLLVERNQFEDAESGEQQGAAADEDAAAVTAVDLVSGEDRWESGERDVATDLEIMAEEGLVLLGAGGSLDRFAADPTPWGLALLDLSTGEPDWTVDGEGETVALGLDRYDETVLVSVDGAPWQIAQQTER